MKERTMNLRTSISIFSGCASLVLILACGGNTPAPAPVVGISVAPTTQTLLVGGTQTFTATVVNTTNTAVTWSVRERAVGGTITSGGLYTAPGTAGTYHVVATSAADATKTAKATVTVNGLPATGLAYVDPTTGSYRLVKNTGLSTATHLVLDLTGVGTTNGAGIAFTFTVDTAKATWAKVIPADTEYTQNGTVLTLGTAPLALKGKVATTTLTGVVGQKGTGASVPLTGVLARVALDFKAGATVGAVTLTSPKAQILQADGTISTVAIVPGTLTTN